MNNLLDLLLNQTCVYYPPGGVDNNGNTTYTAATAVELPCKWQRTVSQVTSRDGKVRTVSATVILKQEVAMNGWLWKGKLVDAPVTPPKDQQIVNIGITDAVDNEETAYTVQV